MRVPQPSAVPLLLVLPTLEEGGMQTRLITVARACARRGARATVMAGGGALESAAAAAADLRLLDWRSGRRQTLRAATEAAAAHAAAVVSADPATLHLLPALAAAGRLHVCLHNPDGSFAGWFRPDLVERLPGLLRALHASGRVSMSASSPHQARAHEATLGLPAGAVAGWPSGVEPPAEEMPPSAGPVVTVAVVSRLSPEKLGVLEAAAELVAAGRARGRDVTLHVHGAGPAEPRVRELLAAALPPGAWALHGPVQHPYAALRGADVLVGMGRSHLEGLVCGRRVVAVGIGPDGAGRLGPMVTAANLDAVAARTFSWADQPPVAAGAVWEALEGVQAREVEALRDLARSRFGADAMLDRLLEIMAATARRDPDDRALARGLAEDLAAAEDELEARRAEADRVWAENRWLRERA